MVKRSIAILVITCLAIFGIVACGGTGTSSSTSTGQLSTTPSSSPVLSPTPSGTLTPLAVTGIAITVNPNNVSSIPCGSSTNFIFSATITVSSGITGGQVPYSWNINHSNISGSVIFAPGETSKTVTYTLNNFVIQLASESPLTGLITVGNPGSSITSSTVGLSGVCKLPGSFQVVNLSISTTPASIAGVACGTTISVVFTATITIAPDSNAGNVQIMWNAGDYHPQASVTFAPAETVKTISLTLTAKLGHLSKFPRVVSIISTSPNVVNSAPAQPAGTCG